MKTVAVVVTYQPDVMDLQLSEIASQCDSVIVVDNGSNAPSLDLLRNLCTHLGVQLVPLDSNTGIAHAQNVGIESAIEQGAEQVLLMDQDSLPEPDMLKKLARVLVEDRGLAAVGPRPEDDRASGDVLIYVDKGWSPKRVDNARLNDEQIDVPFLIASGCLIRVAALQEIGLMREDLFIDHVDLEWGLRARRSGWRLAAVPGAILHHSLGDDAVKLPGRKQPVHVHSVVRNYYLVRNTVVMIRSGVMPWRWRVRYSYWLVKYVGFNSCFAGNPKTRTRIMIRGILDSFRGKMGRLQ